MVEFLFQELSMKQNTLIVYYDSQSDIQLSKNPIVHLLQLEYIDTDKYWAELMTKELDMIQSFCQTIANIDSK